MNQNKNKVWTYILECTVAARFMIICLNLDAAYSLPSSYAIQQTRLTDAEAPRPLVENKQEVVTDSGRSMYVF